VPEAFVAIAVRKDRFHTTRGWGNDLSQLKDDKEVASKKIVSLGHGSRIAVLR
jgi:hypothetical protein